MIERDRSVQNVNAEFNGCKQEHFNLVDVSFISKLVSLQYLNK